MNGGGFLSEILRGVWFLEKMAQAHFTRLLLNHADAWANGSHAAASSGGSDQYDRRISVAFGLESRRMYGYYDEIPNEPYIGITPIEGVVTKYDGWYRPGTMTLQKMMAANDRDPKCIGHFMPIDSPGGSAAYTETFARFIRDEVTKPVVAHTNSLCASAGYYIGCAADELYASQNDDMVGSIGTYCTLYDFSDYLKKLGIAEHEIYANESSLKNDIIKAAFKGDYKPLQEEYLNPVAEQFITTVKDMRPNLTDENAYKGKLYAAKNAPAGMIDGIMKHADALARVEVLAGLKKQ